MKIAVAGGSGTLGRHVVEAARSAGHDVTVLARANGVDVISGAGLVGALVGVETVIDATNLFTTSARKARHFFETASRNLMRAGAQARVGHHVAVSIVGIDDIDASYYAGKLAQERVVREGPVPHTIARVSQFHEFAGQLLATMNGPVAVMPRMLIRPVACREIGAHLVQVAETEPVGRAQDLVGPRDEELAELGRRQLRFDGLRRKVFEVRLPGAYGAGLASGSLRGRRDALQGVMTFDDWLRSDHIKPAS